MDQSHANGMYYIQQVAEITGISKQLIRKWEERYALVQPQRLDNGYRIYSEKDINTLLTVKELSAQGHSVKQAVMMVKEKAEQPERKITPVQEPVRCQEEMNEYVLKLLQQAARCDELEISLLLQQAYHSLGLEAFVQSVVAPFLKEVGSRWERGEWDEYQESLSSLAVRDFLVQIRRNYKCREEAPLVVGACLPHEQHEVPVHLLLLHFMIKGWKTTLIGASPAPGSIEQLVQKLRPAKVLLSATTTIPFEKDPYLLERLDQFADDNRHIDFYIGGAGAVQYASGKPLQAIRIVGSVGEIRDGD
ncbi:MerR family transcriptional regulator [Bacillus badius]|uniref:MerR family transcriptional regulator n=1 Tax=Bacillus badius TaxID=1455 RepID=UPI0005AE0B31|nr:MerR family transcriptional regulator [Bacillus badius]KIL76465.1 Transcriptional regulator, MerR family [Bacillus badius]